MLRAAAARRALPNLLPVDGRLLPHALHHLNHAASKFDIQQHLQSLAAALSAKSPHGMTLTSVSNGRMQCVDVGLQHACSQHTLASTASAVSSSIRPAESRRRMSALYCSRAPRNLASATNLP